jgi:serine/threonine protein kinase
MPRIDICMNCMTPENAQGICVHCGYVNGSATHTDHQLDEGTILKRRYMLGTLLGNGGFSNTYIGWDQLLKTKVAVKEYMPAEIVERNRDNGSIRPIGMSYGEIFEKGKKTFLDEARVLASFEDVPGIVNIRDFFKENNTAYLVMEYLEGVSLHEHLLKLPKKRLPEKEAVRVLLPVIQTLKTVHRTGLIHRDISPDNIIITKEGIIKLIDFGACREFEKANNRTKTIIVKQGYAPPEQYAKNGNQGEWTDIYALGATFYKLLTGKTPPDSLDRMMGTENKSISKPGIIISKKNEEAINKAMSIEPSARFKNVHMFEQAMETFGLDKREIGPDAEKQKKRVRIQALVPVAVLVLLLMTSGLAAFSHLGNNRDTGEIPPQESPNPAEAAPTPQTWYPSLAVESPGGGPPATEETKTAKARELGFSGQLKKTGIGTTSQVVFIIENLTTGGKVAGGYDNLDMDPESTSYTVNKELAVLEGQQIKATVIFDEDRSGNLDPGEAYAESEAIKYTGQQSFNIDFETWHNSRYKRTIPHTTTKNPDGSIYPETTYPENGDFAKSCGLAYTL